MLKRIFNVRNIIFFALIVAFCIVIAGQQGLMNEKRAQYEAALAEKEAIAEEREIFEVERSLVNTDSSDEQRARDSGYIYPDEIEFVYD